MAIKIPKRGVIEVEFEGAEKFSVDLVEAYDRWAELEWVYRDKEGVLPRDHINAHGKNKVEFVQSVIDSHVSDPTKRIVVSRAEAEFFIEEMRKEVEKLRDFFLPKTVENSSSPASTATEVFSQ